MVEFLNSNPIILQAISVFLTLVGFAVVFLVAHTIYRRERFDREKEKALLERRIINSYLSALFDEVEENRALTETIPVKMNRVELTTEQLSFDVGELLLKEPLAYKFFGEEFRCALRVHRINVAVTNRTSDHLLRKFSAGRELSEEDLERFRESVQWCTSSLWVLRLQTQVYMKIFETRDGPAPENAHQVLEWLGDPERSVDEIMTESEKIKCMSPEAVQQLRRNYEQSLKKSDRV